MDLPKVAADGDDTGAPIVVVAHDRHLSAVTAGQEGVVLAADAAAVETHVARRVDEPRLVAIDGTLPRAFATARRLRGRSPSLPLAFLVPQGLLDVTRTRLAFSPELGGAAVLSTDVAAAELLEGLRRTADALGRTTGVRQALDAMNRRLRQVPEQAEPTVTSRVSDRYLAALVRHAPDAIVAVDPAGLVITINETAEVMLRSEADDGEETSLEALLSADDPGELRALLRDAATGEICKRDDVPIVRRDGEHRELAATSAPIVDDHGALAGIVLIARDVTEQRRSEARLRDLQRAESLATLAGGVAHDFNNLLVSVRGWASMAAAEPGDTALVREALSQIQEASDRAAELARSMLAYGGRGDFSLRPVVVDELVDGMRALLNASIDRRTELRLALGAPGSSVLADATQLRQVLLNLVVNANEALDGRPGSITVTTTVDRHEFLPRRQVRLEVADTGPGIAPRYRARVFDPFFTTKAVGRGLGLAASHGIVRAHDGTMSVHGEPGEGAIFRVVLPHVQDTSAPTDEPPAGAPC